MKTADARIESLETRRFYAVTPTAQLTDGTLYVSASELNDTVVFGVKGVRLVPVVNGIGLGRFSTGAVFRIEIQALEGNDIVDVSNLSIPTYVNAGLGNDSVTGGAGNDSLTGAGGKDTLRGGLGNDRLNGGNTNDLIFGESGDDVIYGGFGDDVMDGGGNRNRFFGEDGNDTLIGGKNSDGLYGGGGADLLQGLLGNDILSGDGGQDKLLAGDGADILYGGKGSDWMWGEAGDDLIDAADETLDRLIDGGDGNDKVIADEAGETPVNAEEVTSPEPPPMPPPPPIGGDFAKAVSFGDEAIWDDHFDLGVQTLDDLGVKVARIWLEMKDVNDRPNAWDNVTERDVVRTWTGVPLAERPTTGGLAMKRAFELKQKGFKVILTVSIKDPRAPETTQSVTDMFQFLMDSRRNEDGTGMKLKDAVDAWEVNQEVDIAGNWNPGGVDRADNLRQYVNLELIPAAAALHAGDDVKNWEKIISSSVSFRPDDLRAILTEAQAQNALHHIDYAGYHPYGRYIPSENINELKTRVDGAVAVAKEFGKPLAATEWNVRGYPTDGSRNEEWAQAIDYAYRNLIAPNFGIAVYYTLANDFAGRGGRTSARPAGLLKHDTTLVVTPQSSIDELLAWYRTPLVKSEPFYTTFETLVATQDNNTGN